MPLMFVIAFAVRLSSGEPILFRQRRTGRNDMEFTLFKFRSMNAKSNDAGPLITVRGDRRITSVGSFLRRYKLDQLPQLWNVLRGDMSIVGPRPKLAHREGLFLSAGPGITGAATLAFRNEEALLAALPAGQMDKVYETHFKVAKAQLDAQYMREATFLSDCLIVWATIAACLFPWNTENLFPEEPVESPLPAKATHWGAHIVGALNASQESFESTETPPSKGKVAWQTSLILFCLVLTPVHLCAEQTPKATVSSGPDSRFDAFAGYSCWGAVGSVDNQSLQGGDVGILGGAADVDGQGKGPQLTVGDGLDYELPWLHHRFTARIAQVDSMYDHIDTPTGAGNINSVTFSSAMVMHFGGTRQPRLKLYCSAHPQLLDAGETTTISSTPSGLDPNRPVVYRWASPNLALAASTSGADVETTARQSGTYAVTVQVSQGPKAGQSTTCTTDFELQDAGARS
jgi:lipopolysaccharide/colanic/teichoic acid biosynthesis glycosyltransferase